MLKQKCDYVWIENINDADNKFEGIIYSKFIYYRGIMIIIMPKIDFNEHIYLDDLKVLFSFLAQKSLMNNRFE